MRDSISATLALRPAWKKRVAGDAHAEFPHVEEEDRLDETEPEDN